MDIRITIYGLLFLLMAACNTADKKKTPEQILKEPPFKSISDSIKQFPDNPELYLRRAVLLSQHNLHEIATNDYKKLWALEPQPPVAMQYVNNLLLINQPKQAVDFLKECLQKWPDYADLHRRLSEIYVQVGANENAIEQYDEWIKQDSNNFEVWFDKGLLLAKLQDTPAAIEALERSYSLQRINYNGLALASLYAATKNPKVEAICDELAARDTSGAINDVLYVKGSYYSDTKQYDKALALFDECIRRDWKFADAYIEKGIVRYEQKRYDSALKVFVMAATVANTNPDAYYWMARSYEAMGKKDEAVLNYQRALAIDKSFTEAREGIQRLKK